MVSGSVYDGVISCCILNYHWIMIFLRLFHTWNSSIYGTRDLKIVQFPKHTFPFKDTSDPCQDLRHLLRERYCLGRQFPRNWTSLPDIVWTMEQVKEYQTHYTMVIKNATGNHSTIYGTRDQKLSSFLSTSPF